MTIMRLLLFLSAFGIAAAQPPIPKVSADYQARLAALEQSRQAHPQDFQVLDALAGSYTMGAQYEKAIGVLQQMQGLQPQNTGLQLRVARNYAWAKNSSRAIEVYAEYLQTVPKDRQAAIELIRLRRYRGDYAQAEKLCDRLLENNPEDAEVLALKAEVLHWAGDRRFEARHAADHAARVDPDSPDAKVAQVYALRDLGENRNASRQFEILQKQVADLGGLAPDSSYRDAYKLLEKDLGEAGSLSNIPAYSVYNDSDGIHDDFFGWRLTQPVRGDHALILDVARHSSSAPAGSIFTDGRDRSYLTDVLAGGTLQVAPAVKYTVLAGGSHRNSEGGLRPIFSFRMTASPADRWTFDISAAREFLSVTPRAIDRDISSYAMGAGAQYAFDSRTSVAVRADRRYWSDSNRSMIADATLRRILHYQKHFLVDGGFLNHWETYDRDTQFQAGFFTPDRYLRHDGFLGIHGELKRLIYEFRGSGGAQQVARSAEYRSDWEITASAGLALTRALRLSANYQRRNYSLISRDGWYQGFYIALGVRR
jgi:Flp pilus assembly protein TadD